MWERLNGFTKEDQETNYNATYKDTNCDKFSAKLTVQTRCVQFP